MSGTHNLFQLFGRAVGRSAFLALIGLLCFTPQTFASPVAVSGTQASLSAKSGSSAGSAKTQAIARLRQLQEKQVKELRTLDSTIKTRVQEISGLSLRGQAATEAKSALNRLTEDLSQIEVRREEILARRDFLTQLIFTFDSKWNAQPLQVFLEHRLLDMAINDMTSGNGGGRLWKFMTYLSLTVRETSDPREDFLGLIENYMEYASVLNPKAPSEFLDSRHYSNGTASASAKQADRETLGDHLEKRLEEIQKATAQKIDSKTEGVADIELKLKPGREIHFRGETIQ